MLQGTCQGLSTALNHAHKIIEMLQLKMAGDTDGAYKIARRMVMVNFPQAGIFLTPPPPPPTPASQEMLKLEELVSFQNCLIPDAIKVFLYERSAIISPIAAIVHNVLKLSQS